MEFMTNPWPYINASYGIGLLSLVGFQLWIIIHRRRLRLIERAVREVGDKING